MCVFVSPTNTDKPTKMLFGAWTRVDPSSHRGMDTLQRHAKACRTQSIFLTVFVRGQERCGLSCDQSTVTTCFYLFTRPTTTTPFNGLFSRTTRVSWYQKGKTSLDLNEARDDRLWDAVAPARRVRTICTSLQTDTHTNTLLLNFCRPDAFLAPNQQCQK